MTNVDRSTSSRCDAMPIPARDPDLYVELRSDPHMLAPLRGMIDALAIRQGFGEIHAAHLSLAVDEVLANVIRHGYDRRPDGPIFVRIWRVDDGRPGVLVVVEDRGRQVDPACFRSRPLDELRPGGLGIHIVREVTDGCRFERRHESGMRAVLVKWADDPLPPREAQATTNPTKDEP